MDENELRYFIAIAESGSLSAAADKVFVSQSALSQFLAKTERRIGTRLVRRGPSKQQELTEAGKRYLQFCRDALQLWGAAKQDIDGIFQRESIELAVGVSSIQSAVAISKIAGDFRELFPNLKITIHSAEAKALTGLLLDGKLQIIFSAYIDETPGLKYREISSREVYLLVPHGHPLSAYSCLLPGQEALRIPLSMVGTEPLVMMNPSTVLGQMEQEYCRQIGFDATVSVYVLHVASVMRMVSESGQIGMAPYSFVKGPGNIVPVALESPMRYRSGAITRKDLLVNDMLRQVIEKLTEVYKEVFRQVLQQA